jgi:hypothetical protein
LQKNEFTLFVDEAGDPGLRLIAPHDERGASEWFLLGGVLLRRHYEADLVRWVREMRVSLNATQGKSLHFRKLSATKRLAACSLLAKLPVRAFVVASHKTNMKGHQNPRAAKNSSPDWFYNWCLRLLLERVTSAVQQSCIRAELKVEPIRIVLAERGGHSYGKTAVYLKQLCDQARHGSTVLKRFEVVPDAIDWRMVESVQTNHSAGAQLADIAVSAFYSALRRSGRTDLQTAPAERLAPIMARRSRRVDDFGLVLQPLPWEREIDAIFKDIFRYYGHVL